MRIRRRLPVLVGVLLVIAAVAVVVQLRKHAPPEAARLLPSGDAFFYVNLSWLRRLNAIKQLPPVSHDPEYERFIQETGFQFERDLDRAAFTVHYPASWGGSASPTSADQPRFSEVFEGNIQAEKLTNYLKKIATSVEDYRSVAIYSIPLEGRTVRVAMLSVGTVAVSNHENPAVIRGIIDRSRKLASPFGGPAFLRQYYKYVPSNLPVPTLAWAIVRVENGDRRFPLANGIWSLLIPGHAVVVVSARFLTALHLRAEAFTNSEDDARRVSEQVNTFLSIFHAAENSAAGGTDPDVKQFFDSLKVEQHDDRALLTANLSPGFVKKVFTEPPAIIAPGEEEKKNAPAENSSNQVPARKGRKKGRSK
jgi:hypothetical protein